MINVQKDNLSFLIFNKQIHYHSLHWLKYTCSKDKPIKIHESKTYKKIKRHKQTISSTRFLQFLDQTSILTQEQRRSLKWARPFNSIRGHSVRFWKHYENPLVLLSLSRGGRPRHTLSCWGYAENSTKQAEQSQRRQRALTAPACLCGLRWPFWL